MKTPTKAMRFKKRIMIGIGVILCLVCLVLLYSRYISGDVELNMNLISENNLNLIVDNRDRLLQSGMFKLIHENDAYDTKVLHYYTKIGEEETVVTIYTYGDKPISTPNVFTRYRRRGIINALYRLGSFGECTTTICVDSTRCLIDARFYKTDGTANRFDAIMAEMISIVSQ